MATSITSNVTGATLAAQATPSELWQKGFDVYQQSEDFWKPMEGTTKTAPIMIKRDLSKGKGQKINMRNAAGFYKPAKHGDDQFTQASDFEKFRVNDYSVTVDVLRNGVMYTERSEEWLGDIRGELGSGFNEELGKWYGREKTHKLFMMFLHQGQDANTYFINNRGTRDDLVSSDTLDMDAITGAGVRLKRLNGMPAKLGADSYGNPIHKYCVASTTDALFSLKKDSDYKQQVRDAGERGSSNALFKGGYVELDGQVIKEYNPIDHDGYGPIGSPINPKADLGTAIAAGTAAVDITGGASATGAAETDIEYFRDFPEFAYKFRTNDTLSVAGDDFYVAIVNLEGADAGKFGFYRVDTNNGNKLTTKNEAGNGTSGAGGRLAASVSGNASTRIGNVEWDAAKNTDAHPSGSAVIYCNANGVPLGKTIVMGAAAALRGYGLHDGKRGQESDEDGFINEIYIRGYIGQAPRTDARGRCPGYVVVEHAVEYEGINFTPTLAS